MSGLFNTLEERRFRLVDGYRDAQGRVHREGVIRLARAGDEAAALRDFRVYLRPESFLVVMLTRTIARLGTLAANDGGINAGILERLSETDLCYLADLYRQLNGYGRATGVRGESA